MALRQQASQCLAWVLLNDGQAHVTKALARWPSTPQGQPPDPSVQVAYQVLWHFAADLEANHPDSPHRQEPFYADVQWELLKTLQALLTQGLPAPQDLLACYRLHEWPQQGKAPQLYSQPTYRLPVGWPLPLARPRVAWAWWWQTLKGWVRVAARWLWHRL
jgi:hypothetical protein